MTVTAGHPQITDAMVQQYDDEGYFILEGALSEEQLALLRGEASFAVDRIDREMDEQGVDRIGINARHKRYFSAMVYQERPALREFLFSETMAEVCRATLGGQAFLCWEQYVIKGTDEDTTFAWHQDSGYVHEDAEPYLTCWIALDDVTEENGSIYLLPYSRSGIRSYVKHIRDSRTNDKTCYFGSDPGLPVIARAGSIVLFSSLVIHRSGANRTDRMRSVYLAQYSRNVIMSRDGQQPYGSFDPFLEDGQIVAGCDDPDSSGGRASLD